MENQYSKLYDTNYDEIFKKTEIDIKNILIKGYNDFIGFNRMFDIIYNELELRIKSLYIVQEKEIFREVIEWYGKKEDQYLEGKRHLIFEIKMKNSFKRIEGLKEDFKFLNFIEEFASFHSLIEVKRIWYNSRDIYEYMYELNDYSYFKITSRYVGDRDSLIEMKKLKYKTELKDAPDKYKDFNDYLEKEATYNKMIYSLNNSDFNKLGKSKDDYKNKKFVLKDMNDDTLKKIYNILSLNHIDIKTSFEDFKSVLTEDWGKNDNKIFFSSDTQETTLLLSQLKFIGKGDSFIPANIGRSQKFISKEGSTIIGNLISSSKRSFNSNNNGILNLNSDQKSIKETVDKTVKKLENLLKKTP